MTPIVYLLQAGDTGHVRLGTCPLASLNARITSMQHGNPEPLLLRATLLDTGNTLATLRYHFAPHRYRDDWYQPHVLDLIPSELQRLPVDQADVQRRQAAATLRALAQTGGRR